MQHAWTTHYLITVLLLKQIHYGEEKPRESVTERANQETGRERERERQREGGGKRMYERERGRDLEGKRERREGRRGEKQIEHAFSSTG